MIKQYNNLSGKEITEQQALQSNEFVINFVDNLSNNLVKEEHHIINNQVSFIKYLIYDNESESVIFDYLSNKSEQFQIKKRVIIGNFVVDTNKNYSLQVGNGPLISKLVYNINDLEPEHFICIYVLDWQTNLPIPDRTKKYWYGIDKDGEKYEAIEFSYKEDGSLLEAIDKTPNHSDEQDWKYYDNFQELQSKKQVDLSYYVNSNLTS
ncbi:hypothetical protein [Chryseobacterium paridis]|uniref:Uncharacterized protein n=1 Tax=Chryseobacterium paridis TaxID=2800328 RepID=A0ABS1FXZ2_9FLAO|nr:hypothetical protein [Chryseobacterium paridis]MBK1897277.1 hypothetical protein [Chryseobacterium paridis]